MQFRCCRAEASTYFFVQAFYELLKKKSLEELEVWLKC